MGILKLINKNHMIFFLSIPFLVFISCDIKSTNKSLEFEKYPNLKIGFTTQNFQKAMPVDVQSLTEIIEFASKEGYQFIELRDDKAKLTVEECKILADVARKNNIDVIYETHEGPLDADFVEVFERSLTNTLLFPGPGIIRGMLSTTEFDGDVDKKGWSKEELTVITKLADSCALIAKANNVKLILENLNEPFFGDGSTYFGLNDFFDNSSEIGFQFDIGNPFRSPNRGKADTEKVVKYLSTLGNRWVSSHLKTVGIMGGESQRVLSENPVPIEKIIEMMGQNNVIYACIELSAIPDKQQCFKNHTKSIQFLKDKGILKN